MQAWLSTSFPREDTTVDRTSFQFVIWIASIARQTQSWTLTGFGPQQTASGALVIWPRRAGEISLEEPVSPDRRLSVSPEDQHLFRHGGGRAWRLRVLFLSASLPRTARRRPR